MLKTKTRLALILQKFHFQSKYSPVTAPEVVAYMSAQTQLL